MRSIGITGSKDAWEAVTSPLGLPSIESDPVGIFRVSFRVPQEQLAKLDVMATAEGRSRSPVVLRLLTLGARVVGSVPGKQGVRLRAALLAGLAGAKPHPPTVESPADRAARIAGLASAAFEPRASSVRQVKEIPPDAWIKAVEEEPPASLGELERRCTEGDDETITDLADNAQRIAGGGAVLTLALRAEIREGDALWREFEASPAGRAAREIDPTRPVPPVEPDPLFGPRP